MLPRSSLQSSLNLKATFSPWQSSEIRAYVIKPCTEVMNCKCNSDCLLVTQYIHRDNVYGHGVQIDSSVLCILFIPHSIRFLYHIIKGSTILFLHTFFLRNLLASALSTQSTTLQLYYISFFVFRLSVGCFQRTFAFFLSHFNILSSVRLVLTSVTQSRSDEMSESKF